MITDVRELYWLAGLVEGEGTADLHSGKYPRLRVSMSDADVVGRVAGLFGTEARCSLPNRGYKPMWHARIQGQPAADLIRQLLPLMGARRASKFAEVLGAWELRGSDRRFVAFGGDIERPPLVQKRVRQLVAV